MGEIFVKKSVVRSNVLWSVQDVSMWRRAALTRTDPHGRAGRERGQGIRPTVDTILSSALTFLAEACPDFGTTCEQFAGKCNSLRSIDDMCLFPYERKV